MKTKFAFLSATLALATLAGTPPAQAATPTVTINGYSWGAAWDKCRKKFPKTHSVHKISDNRGDRGPAAPKSVWTCSTRK